MYQDAVARLTAAADLAAQFRDELTVFADTLAGKGWGAQVAGPVQDMHARLTRIEGHYRDLGAQMHHQGERGASAYEQARYVPGPEAVVDGCTGTGSLSMADIPFNRTPPATPLLAAPDVPAEVAGIVCSQCGAETFINPGYKTEVRDSDGRASVWLLCRNDCGSSGSIFSWQVSRDEYQAIFGDVPRNLLLPGDARLRPPAPEERVLPPRPWGYSQVEPTAIPDEAWELTCTNTSGRWHTKCGGILTPDPTRVFYYDEFTSTATLGFRCGACGKPSLERHSWPLSPEQHYAIFGRSLEEYKPELDPDDPDDFLPAYSMWQTADRELLTHFRTLDDLAGSEDYDLCAYKPGQFTIRHWPSGTTWDVPDFVAEHAEVIAAHYDDESEDDD